MSEIPNLYIRQAFGRRFQVRMLSNPYGNALAAASAWLMQGALWGSLTRLPGQKGVHVWGFYAGDGTPVYVYFSATGIMVIKPRKER